MINPNKSQNIKRIILTLLTLYSNKISNYRWNYYSFMLIIALIILSLKI